MLAIARVIGETAPLLVIAGATDSVNFNLFDERMTTLPVFIYSQFTSRARSDRRSSYRSRAWGGALVLIVIVMVLNLVARLIGRIFAPAKDTEQLEKEPHGQEHRRLRPRTSTTATSSPSRAST